jgi:hypothetical protein
MRDRQQGAKAQRNTKKESENPPSLKATVDEDRASFAKATAAGDESYLSPGYGGRRRDASTVDSLLRSEPSKLHECQ